MKLTEKIKDMRRFAALLTERTSAVRVLREIDEEGGVDVGADGGELITFGKDTDGFFAIRSALMARIGAVNEQLRAHGIEIDLADGETGEGDDAPDEEESEDEDALGDAVPA